MAADPSATFHQEAQDLLEQLEAALLDLGENPANQDLIDQVFRALHTIKGSGSMFGFAEVAAFTHHLETAFDGVRKGKLAVGGEMVSLALAAKDHIRAMIERPESADAQAGEAILAGWARLVAGQASAPPPRQAVVTEQGAPQGPTTYRICFGLPRDSMAMGTNPLLLLDELRALGDCTVVVKTDAVPPLEEMDPCDCHLKWEVLLTTVQPRRAIDEVFLFVLDDMELSVEAVDAATGRPGDMLVRLGDVPPEAVTDALSRQDHLGSLLVKSGHLTEDRLNIALAEQRHLRQEAAESKATTPPSGIRVPAERLDALMDQVGELVIAQARLSQLALTAGGTQLKAIAEEVERLAAGLRDTAMGIRMVPIGSLFGRFRRLVHDLGRELGKPVRLTTAGEETELDKTVVERLADPIVHLIRNAADHGIEDAAARVSAGKPAEGTISLAAVHSGTQVLIAIKDDGKGLDRGRIRARAEEAGLIAPGAKVADAELLHCIFEPGFSTAQAITSVSGRGVGMDVVKRTIEGLRGNVEIASAPGNGTQVTLRLPLTLAIIDGLLVRVGGGRYVIPLAAVEECVELSAAEDARSTGRSFLNVRSDLVPFLRLREVFNIPTPADPFQKVVIVASGDRRTGLVVDQIIGNHQTVIKSLSPVHAGIGSFSGATILGDGTVALILDVPRLVEQGQPRDEERLVS